MLIAGDLVRVLQDSYLYPVTLEPWHVKKLREPEYAVVVNTIGTEETTVYLEETKWVVNNKCIQLVSDKDVHKSSEINRK